MYENLPQTNKNITNKNITNKNITMSGCAPDVDTKTVDEQFDIFFEEYPYPEQLPDEGSRKYHRDTYKAFIEAVEETTFAEIMTAVENYKQYLSDRICAGLSEEYPQGAIRWLEGRPWKDENPYLSYEDMVKSEPENSFFEEFKRVIDVEEVA